MWLRDDEPPVSAYGLGGRQNRSDLTQGNIYDHFAVIYEWADGTRTYANTRQIAGCFRQVEDFVYGSAGSAKLCAHQIEGPTRGSTMATTYRCTKPNRTNSSKPSEANVRASTTVTTCARVRCMAILGREVCYTGATLTYEEVANSPQDLRPNSYTSTEGPRRRRADAGRIQASEGVRFVNASVHRRLQVEYRRRKNRLESQTHQVRLSNGQPFHPRRKTPLDQG